MYVKMKPMCDCGHVFTKIDVALKSKSVLKDYLLCNPCVIAPNACPNCGRSVDGVSFQTVQDGVLRYDVNNYPPDGAEDIVTGVNNKTPIKTNEIKSESIILTYGDIYSHFLSVTGVHTTMVTDYRPCCKLFDVPDIPNAIVVWLVNGSKIIYVYQ